MNDPMGKLSLLSIVSLFMFTLSFANQAQAQGMCSEMFNEERVSFDLDKMSELERSETTAEFKKFDQKIRGLEKRIRMYSELTGSETNRTLVEAESYAVKIKDQVRLGLTTKVVEKIGSLFKRYEVDIRVAEKLKIEVLYLRDYQAREVSMEKKADIEKLIKGKQAEKNVLDKHIGQNYYRYITLKEALNQMAGSKVEIVSERAKTVLAELEALATNHALAYGLEFKKFETADIKRYVQSNIKTQHALLKKATMDEFFLMLRLMTFSGPIVNGLKSVLYKIPEKIVMGPFVVPARKVITEAFNVGYTKHLRSTYLEDIEMIIEAKSPVEQFELLRSLNVKSEKPDELVEIFSRVVENTEEWEAIKSVSASKASENERYRLFNERILEADKRALAKDAFPLYYQESGANAFGKIILGSYVGVYIGNKYLGAHPEVTQSFFDGINTFTMSIQNLF
ncbi:MAG: hypothetical protein V4654_06005 [Bdellovibrionota bacterium]